MSRAQGRVGTTDFVGRDADLEVLRAAVDGAIAGSGSIVLLEGEAGIGKTRLAEETATYALGAGAAVLRGAGWEGAGAPAYWPWVQILRNHAAHRDAATLAEELGTGAAEVARMAPELAEKIGIVTGPSDEPEGEQARFRLFDAVGSFLRRATALEPVCIVFDDLHWADVGSVFLLRFLGRELRDAPILVVAALRELEVEPSSAVGRAITDLRGVSATLALRGLQPDDVRELLAMDVGPHEAARLASDVHRRSGGNPLFVRELGRLLVAPERPGLGAGTQVPGSIGSILNRRFAKLSSECVDLLRIASAIGEEFRLPVLERVAGLDREHVLDLLDEALRARLLRETEAAAFTFTHPLVRDALYGDLPLSQRSDVHRRIAETLERFGSETYATELAHHFLLAGDPRGVDQAEAAGRRSFGQLAYEDAASHFARAVGSLSPDAPDERRMDLDLQLGEAQVWSGDLDGARTTYERVAAFARRNDRPDALAQAALGFGAALGGFEVRLYDRAQTDLLEEALQTLGPSDSSLRAQVEALLSVALTFSDSAERRLELAEDAVAVARRVGDARALIPALGAHCDATSEPDHSEQRLAQATEMIRLARDAQDRSMELLGRRHRIIALLELGDIATVDAEIDAYAATAEALRQPLYLWYVPMWRAMRAMMEGRFDDARRLNDQVSHLAERARSENGRLLAAVLRWNILRFEGRSREAAEALREQMKLVGGVAGESFWLSLTLPGEYPEESKAVVARLAANDFAQIPRSGIWLVGMSGLAEACELVGDADIAEKAYRLLLPYASRFAIDGTGTSCYGSTSRDLGVLAKVTGRFDDAAAHFDVALAAHRRAGASALVADTLRAYGSMLIEAGDLTRAEERLGEAIKLYREIGMDLRAEQAQTLLEPRAPSTNTFLREGEFWTLTYEGKTIRLRDAKGLRDIASLIAVPGRELHVADLISAGEGSIPTASDESVIDDRARADYRDRLVDLQEELNEAEEFGDIGRAERARGEMDFLAGELASAIGLGGRARQTVNPAERARKAVAQRIRNALRRIEAEHPALAHHLDRSLQTGSFCSYRPERRVDWQL